MIEFKTKLIKTDVTCVKLFKDYVLSGIGGCLHVFNLNTKKLIHKEVIFEGLKINCIQIDEKEERILFTAENFLKIHKADFAKLTLEETSVEGLKNLIFEEIAVRELKDWILDAQWLVLGTAGSLSEIATVTMHNRVEFWDGRLSVTESAQCEENCILYCAMISYESGGLLVLAGTVFSEILIWKPDLGARACPIWKRLTGHNGVLFSIDHDCSQKMISSTSDDRSTIIWKYEGDFEHIQTNILFGHTARCFRSKITGDLVISAGEDGIVNIWNAKTGAQERSIRAHQEASIWSIDADYHRNVLITGGGDSGVSVFKIQPVITNSSLPEIAVPKRVGILENGDVVLISEQGTLYLWREATEEWDLISKHEQLKSYSILEVSLCRRQIALAGYQGNIYVYKLLKSDLFLDAECETKSKSRIFSLHWLNCDTFLTCERDGLLYLRRKRVLLEVFELPAIKERWTTCASLFSGGGIVLGDRKGNLHVYKLGVFKPVQSIKRAHNYLGVTGLSYCDGIITSLGRDSTIRRYRFTQPEQKLTQISEDKVPFAWLTALDTAGILTAFNGSRVVFWDYANRRTVLETECGGGHRSHSFLNKPEKATFVYIKDKTINRVCFHWDSNRASDLTVGINACAEINSLCCLSSEEANSLVLFTGGEDTTLRVSKFEHLKFLQTGVLKSHLSSVRCLHLNNGFLFSAGGRGQIIMWRVDEYVKNCKLLKNIEIENTEKQNIEIQNTEIQNTEIRNTEIRNTEKQNTEIRNTEIQNTEIQNTEIQNTEIRNTEIRNTEKQNTKIRNTEIQNTEIQNTEIRNTEKQNTEIRNTEIQNTEIQNTEIQNTEIQNTEIRNTDKQNTEIRNTEIQNTEIQNTEIRNTEKQNTEIRNKIRNTEIQNTEIQNTEIQNTEIQNTEIRNTEKQNTEIRNTEIQNTEIQNTEIRNTEIQNTEIRNTEIRNTEKQNTEIRNTEIQNTEIQNTEIQNTEIRNTEIQNTEIRNTEIRNTEIQNTEIRNTEIPNTEKQNTEIQNTEIWNSEHKFELNCKLGKEKHLNDNYGGNCVQVYSHYEQLDEDEGEVRVMDLTTYFNKSGFYLLAACSDGKIKLFKIQTDKFTYTDCFQYERRCILKIALLNNFLISMATDGFLTFWNFDERSKFLRKFKAHQSGINSYSHAETKSGTHLIVTGGDDNALTINEFKIIDDRKILNLRSFTKSDSHCAQITGVYLNAEGWILSVGLDKRLLVFEFEEFEEDSFAVFCAGAYETSVSDVKGLVVHEGDNFEVILYGLGLEILHVVNYRDKRIL